MCEQLVIIGVVKISLHTWQRNDDSSGARPASGVFSQSVLSVTVDTSMANVLPVTIQSAHQASELEVQGRSGNRDER